MVQLQRLSCHLFHRPQSSGVFSRELIPQKWRSVHKDSMLNDEWMMNELTIKLWWPNPKPHNLAGVVRQVKISIKYDSRLRYNHSQDKSNLVREWTVWIISELGKLIRIIHNEFIASLWIGLKSTSNTYNSIQMIGIFYDFTTHLCYVSILLL